MNRKYLLKTLRRYRENKATAEERAMIDNLYEAMGKDGDTPLDVDKEKELEAKYWRVISASMGETRHAGGRTRILVTWSSIGVAACLLAGVALYLFQTDKGSLDEAVPTEIIAEADNAGKILSNDQSGSRLFLLDDGTRVTLEPASQLVLMPGFGDSNREVRLEGGAYFEVFHDKSLPFLVHANGVTARVVGTCFSVKAFLQEKDVTVAVSEGRVKVYTASSGSDNSDESDELLLTPNQQIVYDRESESIKRGLVENPKAVIPTQEIQRIRFEEKPVTEILDVLARVYGVEIVFDEQVLSNCILTTAIGDGDFYGRLDVICNAINATYRLNENKIEVSSDGCSME